MSSTSVGSFSPGKSQSQIPVPSSFYPNSQRVKAKKKSPTSIDVISPGNLNCHNRTGPSRKSCENSNEPISRSRMPENGRPIREISTNGSSIFSRTRNPNNNGKKSKTAERFPKVYSAENDVSENKIGHSKSYTVITLPSPIAEDRVGGTRGISTPDSMGNQSDIKSRESSFSEENEFCRSATASNTHSNLEIRPFADGRTLNGEYSVLGGEIDLFEEDGDPRTEFPDVSVREGESQTCGTVTGGSTSPTGKIPPVESSKSDQLQMARSPVATESVDQFRLPPPSEFPKSEIVTDQRTNQPSRSLSHPIKEKEGENWFVARGRISLNKDRANDCRSGKATEADLQTRLKYAKSETNFTGVLATPGKNHKADNNFDVKSSRIGRENEILTDVSYMQFVYHPTVLKRKTREYVTDETIRPRSKSIEDRSTFANGESRTDDGQRGIKKGCFKKNFIQTYVSNRDVNFTPLRNWSDGKPKHEERQFYDRVHLMRNLEYVLKDIKRERTKRERMTGAVLKIAAKFIHLLAMLNLWPGDNCQLLISHSIRFGR